MKSVFYITILILSLIGCHLTTPDETANKWADGSVAQMVSDTDPELDVKISLTDSSYDVGEDIFINIKLTNTTSTNQKVLFDKPISPTRGPWSTAAMIVDLKTDKSVVKFSNKLFSTQLNSEDDLENSYYNLMPTQSIHAEYKLTDLVDFNTEDNILPTGTYSIQIFSNSNFSNSLILNVE